MACMDQQPNFKHYCRVCKKGFMCGRALGGHMRAHGIGDESGNLDDDDPISDWEEKYGGGSERTSNKRMYQLRTNPNRLRSCRTCENCGKEFLSWKSFLEHGKCSSDDASDSLISSHESEGDEDECAVGSTRCGSRWSKRKRSLRSKVSCFSASSYPPSDDDDILLARCLVQLANTVVDPPTVEPEESCASASREAEERRNHPHSYFDPSKSKAITSDHHRTKGVPTPRGMFECKACKKLFNSHQALGGHRASHKKVKGCYAAKQDQMQQDYNNSALALEDDAITNNEEFLIPPSKPTPSNFQFEQGPSLVGTARRKPKVHECSICHRVFASGQALGGHKRCHWITSNSPETSSLPKFHFQDNNSSEPIHLHHHHHKSTINVRDKLDLNVPAWAHVPDITGYPPDPLGLNISTDMQLQPWIAPDTKDDSLQLKKGDDDDNINGNIVVSSNVQNETVDNNNTKTQHIEDEADSKLIKLGRLNDLNEMVSIGSPSKWLQVGIGSTTRVDIAADM